MSSSQFLGSDTEKGNKNGEERERQTDRGTLRRKRKRKNERRQTYRRVTKESDLDRGRKGEVFL